jgi:hypothetical protein
MAQRPATGFGPGSAGRLSARSRELQEKRKQLQRLREQHEQRMRIQQYEDEQRMRATPNTSAGGGGDGEVGDSGFPPELDGLLRSALRHGLTTEGNIDVMRRHIASGRFDHDHYIQLWSSRVAAHVGDGGGSSRQHSSGSARRARGLPDIPPRDPGADERRRGGGWVDMPPRDPPCKRSLPSAVLSLE